VLARFEGLRCPFVLVEEPDTDRIRLLTLEPGDHTVALGNMPDPCRLGSCLFWGRATALGPLVVAVREAAESEAPGGVLLGVPRAGALSFVDLWANAGESVVGDATDLGPAFALEPWRCGETLGLFVRSRLPAARGAESPEELRAREGGYGRAEEPLERTPRSRAGCVRIELGLP
jgi:hypothetical protein